MRLWQINRHINQCTNHPKMDGQTFHFNRQCINYIIGILNGLSAWQVLFLFGWCSTISIQFLKNLLCVCTCVRLLKTVCLKFICDKMKIPMFCGVAKIVGEIFTDWHDKGVLCYGIAWHCILDDETTEEKNISTTGSNHDQSNYVHSFGKMFI